MNNTVLQLTSNISLKYLETLKISDSDFYKYEAIFSDADSSNSYNLYSNVIIDTNNLNKEELALQISNKIKENPSEKDIFIDLDNSDVTEPTQNSVGGGSGEETSQRSYKPSDMGNNEIYFPTNVEKFSEAYDIIQNMDCDLENCLNGMQLTLNSQELPNSYNGIADDVTNVVTKLSTMDGGELGKGPVAVVSNYKLRYREILDSMLDTLAAEYEFKLETGSISLSAGSLAAGFNNEDYLNEYKNIISKCRDKENGYASLTEVFKELEGVYAKYSVTSFEEAQDILNADIFNVDGLEDMTEEEKEEYIKNLNIQKDNIFASLNAAMGITRETFDNLIKNDVNVLARYISEASIAAAKNVVLGNADETKLNEALYNLQDIYYGTKDGQEYLLKQHLERSGTEYDEYNAIGYTNYIKFCMSSGHTHDWLMEDLRAVAGIIGKINSNSNFSYQEEITDKEEISAIKKSIEENRGMLPYNIISKDGKYYQIGYTKLGDDMLYYMDYHWGENVGNSGDNKIITAFSNQGYVDAVERNYKGLYIEQNSVVTEEFASDIALEKAKEQARSQAERDYYILNGVIQDPERYKELVEEGKLSFEQLKNYIDVVGGEVSNLTNLDYINSNKEEIMAKTGLTESQLYNFAIKNPFDDANNGNIFLDAQQAGSKLFGANAAMAAIQLVGGIAKFGENVLDAAQMAVNNDFFLNGSVTVDAYGNFIWDFTDLIELKQEYNEFKTKCWEDFVNSGLYEEQYNAYMNSEAGQQAAWSYYNKYCFDYETGRYLALDGKYYYSYEDIPLSVRNGILPSLFEGHKYAEWSLTDSSSSNYYLATFKEGIRNGGVFDSFDNLSEKTVTNANIQLETMKNVAVDNIGNWMQNEFYDKDWYKDMEQYSFIKHDNILGMTVNQIGNMAIPVALSAIPGIGPVVGQTLSSAALFTSAFGGAAEEAINSGATYNEALAYATLSATTELVIEKVFSGVAGYGEGWLDNLIEAVPNNIINKFGLENNLTAQVVKKLITGGIGEGVEEVTTDFVTPLWQSLTYLSEKSYGELVSESVSLENEVQTFLVSFLSSMVFGSSEIVQKTNYFNQKMQNLDQSIAEIPGMKEAANKVLAEIIGYDTFEETGVTRESIINKIIENNSIELAQNPDTVKAVQQLQQQLLNAKSDLAKTQVTIKTDNGDVNVSKSLVMNVADMFGLDGKYSIDDGVVTFKNDKVQNKFIEAVYTSAQEQLRQHQKLYSDVIDSYEKAISEKKYTSNLESAIETLKNEGDQKNNSEVFKSVKFEIDGKEIEIPQSVVQEITSKYNIDSENRLVFTDEMTNEQFATSIYEKAIQKATATKTGIDLQMSIFNNSNAKKYANILNSATEIVEQTITQNDNQVVITNSTKVDGKDLVKLEVETTIDGEQKTVNVYVDDSTSASVYKEGNKAVEKIQEVIEQNKDSDNVYVGQMTYDKSNDVINTKENADNKAYVDLINKEKVISKADNGSSVDPSANDTSSTLKTKTQSGLETKNETAKNNAETDPIPVVASGVAVTMANSTISSEANTKYSTNETGNKNQMSTSDTTKSEVKNETNTSVRKENGVNVESQTSTTIQIDGKTIEVDALKKLLEPNNLTESLKTGEYLGVKFEKALVELSKVDGIDLEPRLQNLLEIASKLDENQIILNKNEMYSQNNVDPLILTSDFADSLTNEQRQFLTEISSEQGLIDYLNTPNSLSKIGLLENSEILNSDNKYIQKLLKLTDEYFSYMRIYNVEDVIKSDSLPIMVAEYYSGKDAVIRYDEVIKFIKTGSFNDNYSFSDYVEVSEKMISQITRQGGKIEISETTQNIINAYKGLNVHYNEKLANLSEVIANPDAKRIVLPKTINYIDSSQVYSYLTNRDLLTNLLNGEVKDVNVAQMASALKTVVMMQNHLGIELDYDIVDIVEKIYKQNLNNVDRTGLESKLSMIYQDYANYRKSHSLGKTIKYMDMQYDSNLVAEAILSDAALVPNYNRSRALYNKAYDYLVSKGFTQQEAANKVMRLYEDIIELRGYDTLITDDGLKIHVQKGINWNNQAFTLEYVQREISKIKSVYKTNIPVDIYIYDTFNPADKYWEIEYNMPNFKSAATGGNNTISIYKNDSTFDTALSHEYAHIIDTQIMSDNGLTGRFSDLQEYKDAILKDNNRPSDYAGTNACEDFAESVAHMYNDPSYFKQNFPNRYQVLSKYINVEVEVQNGEVGRVSYDEAGLDRVFYEMAKKYDVDIAKERLIQYANTGDSSLIIENNNARNIITNYNKETIIKYLKENYGIPANNAPDVNKPLNAESSSKASDVDQTSTIDTSEPISEVTITPNATVETRMNSFIEDVQTTSREVFSKDMSYKEFWKEYQRFRETIDSKYNELINDIERSYKTEINKIENEIELLTDNPDLINELESKKLVLERELNQKLYFAREQVLQPVCDRVAVIYEKAVDPNRSNSQKSSLANAVYRNISQRIGDSDAAIVMDNVGRNALNDMQIFKVYSSDETRLEIYSYSKDVTLSQDIINQIRLLDPNGSLINRIVIRDTLCPETSMVRLNSNMEIDINGSVDAVNGVIEIWNGEVTGDTIIYQYAQAMFRKLINDGTITAESWQHAMIVDKLMPTLQSQNSINADFADSMLKFIKNPNQFKIGCPNRYSLLVGTKNTKASIPSNLLKNIRNGKLKTIVNETDIQLFRKTDAYKQRLKESNAKLLQNEAVIYTTNYDYVMQHLVSGGEYVPYTAIFGAHNMNFFNDLVNKSNGMYIIGNPIKHPYIEGIYNIEYTYKDSKEIIHHEKKTIYDPKVFKDSQMMELATNAITKSGFKFSEDASLTAYIGLAPNGLWFQGYFEKTIDGSSIGPRNLTVYSNSLELKSVYPILELDNLTNLFNGVTSTIKVPIVVNGEMLNVEVTIEGKLSNDIFLHGDKLIQKVEESLYSKYKDNLSEVVEDSINNGSSVGLYFETLNYNEQTGEFDSNLEVEMRFDRDGEIINQDSAQYSDIVLYDNEMMSQNVDEVEIIDISDNIPIQTEKTVIEEMPIQKTNTEIYDKTYKYFMDNGITDFLENGKLTETSLEDLLMDKQIDLLKELSISHSEILSPKHQTVLEILEKSNTYKEIQELDVSREQASEMLQMLESYVNEDGTLNEIILEDAGILLEFKSLDVSNINEIVDKLPYSQKQFVKYVENIDISERYAFASFIEMKDADMYFSPDTGITSKLIEKCVKESRADILKELLNVEVDGKHINLEELYPGDIKRQQFIKCASTMPYTLHSINFENIEQYFDENGNITSEFVQTVLKLPYYQTNEVLQEIVSSQLTASNVKDQTIIKLASISPEVFKFMAESSEQIYGWIDESGKITPQLFEGLINEYDSSNAVFQDFLSMMTKVINSGLEFREIPIDVYYSLSAKPELLREFMKRDVYVKLDNGSIVSIDKVFTNSTLDIIGNYELQKYFGIEDMTHYMNDRNIDYDSIRNKFMEQGISIQDVIDVSFEKGNWNALYELQSKGLYTNNEVQRKIIDVVLEYSVQRGFYSASFYSNSNYFVTAENVNEYFDESGNIKPTFVQKLIDLNSWPDLKKLKDNVGLVGESQTRIVNFVVDYSLDLVTKHKGIGSYFDENGYLREDKITDLFNNIISDNARTNLKYTIPMDQRVSSECVEIILSDESLYKQYVEKYKGKIDPDHAKAGFRFFEASNGKFVPTNTIVLDTITDTKVNGFVRFRTKMQEIFKTLQLKNISGTSVSKSLQQDHYKSFLKSAMFNGMFDGNANINTIDVQTLNGLVSQLERGTNSPLVQKTLEILKSKGVEYDDSSIKELLNQVKGFLTDENGLKKNLSKSDVDAFIDSFYIDELIDKIEGNFGETALPKSVDKSMYGDFIKEFLTEYANIKTVETAKTNMITMLTTLPGHVSKSVVTEDATIKSLFESFYEHYNNYRMKQNITIESEDRTKLMEIIFKSINPKQITTFDAYEAFGLPKTINIPDIDINGRTYDYGTIIKVMDEFYSKFNYAHNVYSEVNSSSLSQTAIDIISSIADATFDSNTIKTFIENPSSLDADTLQKISRVVRLKFNYLTDVRNVIESNYDALKGNSYVIKTQPQNQISTDSVKTFMNVIFGKSTKLNLNEVMEQFNLKTEYIDNNAYRFFKRLNDQDLTLIRKYFNVESGGYMLNTGKNISLAQKAELHNALAEENRLFSLKIMDELFDTLDTKHNSEFSKFINDNIEKIAKLPESDRKILSIIQNRFDEIQIKYANQSTKISLEQVLNFISANPFSNVENGNYSLAMEAKDWFYSESEEVSPEVLFDKAQRIYNTGRKRIFSEIPKVEFKYNDGGKTYNAEILSLDDARAIFIGNESDCCQAVGDAGETAMIHSAIDKSGRVFTIRDDSGRLIAQSWLWRNENMLCFDNIEIPTKAKGNIASETIFKIYGEMSKQLVSADTEVYDRLLKDGIITQEEYDKTVIKEVTVGKGNSDVKIDEVLLKRSEIVFPKITTKEISSLYHGDVSAGQYYFYKVGDENYSLNIDENVTGIKVPDVETVIRDISNNGLGEGIYSDEFKVQELTEENELQILRILQNFDTKYNDIDTSFITENISEMLGLKGADTKVMVSSNFVIVYEEIGSEIVIGDVLTLDKVSGLNNEVIQLEDISRTQVSQAIRQLETTGKTINIEKLSSEKLASIQEVISPTSKIEGTLEELSEVNRPISVESANKDDVATDSFEDKFLFGNNSHTKYVKGYPSELAITKDLVKKFGKNTVDRFVTLYNRDDLIFNYINEMDVPSITKTLDIINELGIDIQSNEKLSKIVKYFKSFDGRPILNLFDYYFIGSDPITLPQELCDAYRSQVNALAKIVDGTNSAGKFLRNPDLEFLKTLKEGLFKDPRFDPNISKEVRTINLVMDELLNGKVLANIDAVLHDTQAPIFIDQSLYEMHKEGFELLPKIIEYQSDFKKFLENPDMDVLLKLNGLFEDSRINLGSGKNISKLHNVIGSLIDGKVLVNIDAFLHDTQTPIFIDQSLYEIHKEGFELLPKIIEYKSDLRKFLENPDMDALLKLNSLFEDSRINLGSNENISKLHNVIGSLIDGKVLVNANDYLYFGNSPVLVSKEFYQLNKSAVDKYVSIVMKSYELKKFLTTPDVALSMDIKKIMDSNEVMVDSKYKKILSAVIDDISSGKVILNAQSVVYSNAKPLTITGEVYNLFVKNNPNPDVTINQLYAFITSNEEIYKLLNGESFETHDINKIKESLEYLVSAANQKGYEDVVVREANYLLNAMQDTYQVDELYDIFSIAHTEFNTPEGYYEFVDLLKTVNEKGRIDTAIQILENSGYTNEQISEIILQFASRESNQTFAKHFYYRAFDYLVEKGMDEKEAAILIKNQYTYIMARRGTRVIATTSSGIRISIINNLSTNNKLLTKENIERILSEASKYYYKTGLEDVLICDTFSPRNIYSEKVQYEDYYRTHMTGRFIAAASADSKSIMLWEDFGDLYSIIHEYGHTIDRHIQSANNLSSVFSKTEEWNNAIKLDSYITSKRVSDYANASNQEDFAEFLEYFHKNPLDVALKYPNRYKAASKYLNMQIDSDIIQKYIDSRPLFEIIERMSPLLTENGNALEFVKQYVYNQIKETNSFTQTLVTELDSMYQESRFEILEDYGVYFILEDMKTLEGLNTNEFLDVIKNYLDGKDVTSAFSDSSNLELLKMLEKDQIQEWYEEELIEATAESEPIKISDEEFDNMMNNLFNNSESDSSSDTILRPMSALSVGKDVTSIYDRVTSNELELERFLKNPDITVAKEIERLLADDLETASSLKSKLQNVISDISNGNYILNVDSYVYGNMVEPVIIPKAVYEGYISANPNSDITIKNLFDTVSSNDVYNLIDRKTTRDTKIFDSLESLIKVAKENGCTDNKFIQESESILKTISETSTKEEAYDMVSKIHCESQAMNGYHEFVESLNSNDDINKVIKGLENKGFNRKNVSEMLLTHASLTTDTNVSEELYYKAYDYLVKNGMTSREAAITVKMQYQELLDRRGTRIIATTSSGINIRIINNCANVFSLSNIQDIQQRLTDAEKLLGKSLLKDVYIYDTHSPSDMLFEVEQYKDCVDKNKINRYIAGATASDTRIDIWGSFTDIDSIVHEYSHTVDYNLGKKLSIKAFSDTEMWKNAMALDSKITSKRVSSYAYTTNMEDFAEFMKYYYKNPVDVALKYPNRYAAIKGELNIKLDMDLVGRYISNSNYISFFNDISQLLNTNSLDLIKKYIFNESIDMKYKVIEDIFDALDSKYPNRLDILKDISADTILNEIAKSNNMNDESLMDILKDYIDGENINEYFDSSDLNLIKSLDFEQVKDCYYGLVEFYTDDSYVEGDTQNIDRTSVGTLNNEDTHSNINKESIYTVVTSDADVELSIPNELVTKYGKDIIDEFISIYTDHYKLVEVVKENNMEVIQKFKGIIEDLDVNADANETLHFMNRVLSQLDGRDILNIYAYVYANATPVRISQELYNDFGEQVNALVKLVKNEYDLQKFLKNPDIKLLTELKEGLFKDSRFDSNMTKEINYISLVMDDLIDNKVVVNAADFINYSLEPVVVDRTFYEEYKEAFSILESNLYLPNLYQTFANPNVEELSKLKQLFNDERMDLNQNNIIKKLSMVIDDLIQNKVVINPYEFLNNGEAPILDLKIVRDLMRRFDSIVNSLYDLADFLKNPNIEEAIGIKDLLDKGIIKLSDNKIDTLLAKVIDKIADGNVIINAGQYVFTDKSPVYVPVELVQKYLAINNNSSIGISQLYNFISFREEVYKLLGKEAIEIGSKGNFVDTGNIIESLKSLVKVANEVGYSDISFIQESKAIVELLEDTSLTEEQLYDKLSIIHVEHNLPEGYHEFIELYNKTKSINSVIKEFTKRGYTKEAISEIILNYSSNCGNERASSGLYYKAYKYLVKEGMSQEDAATLVKNQANMILDRRGTRVVATTSSGINIRVVNNSRNMNKLLSENKIMEVMNRAEKIYSKTDLKNITIYDTFSPSNIYYEKVQYKDYNSKLLDHRFISQASANDTDIYLWKNFSSLDTIIHEYTHTIDYYIKPGCKFSYTDEWDNAIINDEKVSLYRVSDYANANNAEDFAEFIMYYSKNPIGIALKYPNRYNISSQYLNMQIDSALITKYVNSHHPVEIFTKISKVLRQNQNTNVVKIISDFIQGRTIDTEGNTLIEDLINELSNKYVNRKDILKDIPIKSMLNEISTSIKGTTYDWYSNFKDYLNDKILKNKFNDSNQSNYDSNESIIDIFRKPTYDLDLFKETLLNDDIKSLSDGDLSILIDNIKKGRINLKKYNLSSDSIGLLIDKVPLSKIFPLSNVRAVKTFINHFGLETILEFDRLNNGFLLGENAESLYSLYDYFDLSIPEAKGTDKLSELENLITTAITTNKTNERRTYIFDYEKLAGTTYASKHEELFLDATAPDDLKSAYYKGIVNSGNEYKNEWTTYLEGKNISGTIHESLISIDDSNILENINALGESVQHKYKMQLHELALRVGLSDEEVQSILSKKIQDLINESSFGVRRTMNSLLKILEDGKLKNQFEVNHSTYGINDSSIRMDVEKETMGIPRNIRYEDRPIYGMLLPKDTSSRYVLKGPGSYYSDGNGVIYIFDKSKILDKATIMLGDTITHGNQVAVTSAKDPKFFGVFEEILKDIKTKEDLENFDFREVYDKSILEVGNSAYYEFQLHGESTHTLDNIKEILFLKYPDDEIINRLKELNISWKVLK